MIKILIYKIFAIGLLITAIPIKEVYGQDRAIVIKHRGEQDRMFYPIIFTNHAIDTSFQKKHLKFVEWSPNFSIPASDTIVLSSDKFILLECIIKDDIDSLKYETKSQNRDLL